MASTRRNRGIGPQPVLVRVPGTKDMYFVREIEEMATTCRQCKKPKKTLYSYLQSVAGGFCRTGCFMKFEYKSRPGLATPHEVRVFKANKARKKLATPPATPGKFGRSAA